MSQKILGKRLALVAITVVFLLVVPILFTGCVDARKVVARKMVEGKELTKREQAVYEKYPAKVNEFIARLKAKQSSEKQETSQEAQKKETQEASSREIITYKTNSGNAAEFDVSHDAQVPFGFFHGDRVRTPDGDATVVGVREDELWFHVDSDLGAAFWSNHKKADFEKDGFVLLKSAEREQQATVGARDDSRERMKDEMKNWEELNKQGALRVANGNPSKTFVPKIEPIEDMQ
jgi:hypothetical protein